MLQRIDDVDGFLMRPLFLGLVEGTIKTNEDIRLVVYRGDESHSKASHLKQRLETFLFRSIPNFVLEAVTTRPSNTNEAFKLYSSYAHVFENFSADSFVLGEPKQILDWIDDCERFELFDIAARFCPIAARAFFHRNDKKRSEQIRNKGVQLLQTHLNVGKASVLVTTIFSDFHKASGTKKARIDVQNSIQTLEELCIETPCFTLEVFLFRVRLLTLQKQREYDLAIQTIQQIREQYLALPALKSKPLEAEFLLQEGFSYHSVGNFQESISSGVEAITLFKFSGTNYFFALENLLKSYLHNEQPEHVLYTWEQEQVELEQVHSSFLRERFRILLCLAEFLLGQEWTYQPAEKFAEYSDSDGYRLLEKTLELISLFASNDWDALQDQAEALRVFATRNAKKEDPRAYHFLLAVHIVSTDPTNPDIVPVAEKQHIQELNNLQIRAKSEFVDYASLWKKLTQTLPR